MKKSIENALIEKVLDRQERTNERILKEIADTISQIGELLPSQYDTIGQELKYGENLDKIIEYLEKQTNLTKQDILKMFEQRAKTDYDFAEKYYRAKNVEYLPYEENLPLKNKIDEIALATFDDFFELSTFSNVAHTTGITFLDFNGNKVTKNIVDAYRQIVDDSIMSVRMGKESFYTTLSKQLKVMGESGIQKIEYESGYHRRIDSALRMNLQDGLNEMAMAQQEIIGKQFGADGVEITVHDNPAPDHAPLQGHIFAKDEFEKLQAGETASDIDGEKFQIKRAIGQWNCYHEIFDIVLGIDEPIYSKKELQKIIENNEKGFEYEGEHYTNYEGQQKQRQLELEIRKAREKAIMQKKALQNTKDEFGKEQLQKDINKTNNRINLLLNKYHDFSKKSGLPTKLERARLLTKS